MTYNKVRGMNYQVLKQPYQLDENYKQIDLAVKRNKLHSNLMSCGKTMWIRGRDITYYCRKPICPSCSAYAAKRMATKFISQFPEADKSSFRMMTLGIDYAYDATEALAYFDQWRDDIRTAIKSIRNRHPRQNPERFLPWSNFSMSGSLEIDAFRCEQFKQLGTAKQGQYTNEFEYDPAFLMKGSVYVVTFHCCIYKEGLEDDEIEEFFKKHAKRVHLQKLYTQQTNNEAVSNVIGYGHKVEFSTCLAGRNIHKWSDETMDEYIDSIAFCKGRQGFKFRLKQKRSKKR